MTENKRITFGVVTIVMGVIVSAVAGYALARHWLAEGWLLWISGVGMLFFGLVVLVAVEDR